MSPTIIVICSLAYLPFLAIYDLFPPHLQRYVRVYCVFMALTTTVLAIIYVIEILHPVTERVIYV